MSTKALIQKVRAEIEAHEGRGWLKGYEEGLAVREEQTVNAQNANEKLRARIEELKVKRPAPTTAREALDLAWELAHPVREGQQIPSDMVCLQDEGDRITMIITPKNWTPTFPESIRTLDPLPEPEPEPDWLDAHAVLARHVEHAPDSRPSLWVNLGGGMWGHAETTKRATVWDLRDVTPLYPKEDA